MKLIPDNPHSIWHIHNWQRAYRIIEGQVWECNRCYREKVPLGWDYVLTQSVCEEYIILNTHKSKEMWG